MKHGLNILFCLYAFGLTAACDSSDPCSGGWMTFYVDEQGLVDGTVTGKVCDGNEGCAEKSTRTIPGFWGACANSPSLCGAPTAWVCMQPGAMSYEIDGTAADADPAKVAGTFNIPPVDGSNCRMRAYVNSASPHLQTLTCGPGQFYGPDAQFGSNDPDEGTASDPGNDKDTVLFPEDGDHDEGAPSDVDVLNPCGQGVCQPTWLGDGSCDAACTCAATEFDGRDCDPTEG